MKMFECPFCHKITQIVHRRRDLYVHTTFLGLGETGLISVGTEEDRYFGSEDCICENCKTTIPSVKTKEDIVQYLEKHGLDIVKIA
jgi:hypothetical protein